jgi:excinuclease UvrABC nuclease subunit
MQKEKQMNGAVKILDFETAAILRDEIKAIKENLEKIEKKKVKAKKAELEAKVKAAGEEK